MAIDEGLLERLREITSELAKFEEKKMFGGVAFMLNGHMTVGTSSDELMVRLGKERAAEALQEAHVREMDFTGRVITTMVYVRHQGISEDADLRAWVQRAIDYNHTLEPK